MGRWKVNFIPGFLIDRLGSNNQLLGLALAWFGFVYIMRPGRSPDCAAADKITNRDIRE
jgi:hypothetical protein